MRLSGVSWPAILLAALFTACSDGSTTPDGSPRSLDHTVIQGDDGCGDLSVAPDSVRVDLIDPTFSDPTAIANPLFPVGDLQRVLLTGISDGARLRTETTRLDGTRTIVVDGVAIETIVSQYVAWLDRRIAEVALDFYGEDDEGNVWYFGEDVFNYEDGVVVDTEGTWLAGVDGPFAMIMPDDPQVGEVWRPENACPVVFEEVTALETGVTVEGPQGPVAGALVVRELHLDGGTEDKIFAPGYGEFATGSGLDEEAVALAIPTNSLPGEEPEELDDLSDDAERMFRVVRTGNWRRARSLFRAMEEDWGDYAASGVPDRIAAEMDEAMESLGDAVRSRARREALQASVDVSFSTLDFELQYDDREEIDLDLIGLWTRQLQIDREVGDESGIRSDLESIRVIRDRLGEHVAASVDGVLAHLQRAAIGGDLPALVEAGDAAELRIQEMKTAGLR